MFLKFRFGIAVLVALFIQAQIVQADVVNLTLDPTQSDMDVSVNNSPFDNSQVSGTAVVDVASCVDPFGIAQIIDMDLVLDDGLTFDLGGGLVTGTTQPGDVMIMLDSPGTGGVVTGGTFDQLGNAMSLTGDLNVADPFNLAGGDQVIDLSTVTPGLVDFLGVQISRVGNTKIVSATFQITDQVNVGGTDFPFVANGSFVATGTVPAVPEPASAFWILGIGGFLATQRTRKSIC